MEKNEEVVVLSPKSACGFRQSDDPNAPWAMGSDIQPISMTAIPNSVKLNSLPVRGPTNQPVYTQPVPEMYQSVPITINDPHYDKSPRPAF
jgi:hypothetical protein